MNLEPCIPPGEIYLPCMYQFESDLQMIPIEVEYQLKVFEGRALGTPRLSKCMSSQPMNLDMSN